MRVFAGICVLWWIGLLSGCMTTRQVPSISLPQAHSVEWIEVRSRAGHDAIQDHAQIESVMNLLHQLNSDWETTWHTPPTPEYTIRINRADGGGIGIWLSGSWIGYRDRRVAHFKRLASVLLNHWWIYISYVDDDYCP